MYHKYLSVKLFCPVPSKVPFIERKKNEGKLIWSNYGACDEKKIYVFMLNYEIIKII